MTSLGHAIDALCLTPDDQQWLLSVLSEIPADYGHRAAISDTTRRTLELVAPSRLPELDAYNAMWPAYPRFSIRPAREIFLVSCCGASLAFPRLSLHDAFCTMARKATTSVLRSSPVMRPLFLACDGDPAHFLQATARANRLVDNFGQRTLARLGPSHFVFELRDWPPQYAAILVCPYLEGVLELFGRTGEVELERPDDARIHVYVRWT